MARMTLEDLSAQLQAAFGRELRAVVLYGSAVTSEHVAGKSDYNVLVIVARWRREGMVGVSWSCWKAAPAQSW
jgi:hypothetical protein